MARDFKLSNFTFTTVTAAAGTFGVTPTTPTGDVANSGATLGLSVVTSGTGTGSASDTKQVMGFRNSKIDTSGTLANFLAGNEISAISNDPVLPGNTSYGEMFMSFNMLFNMDATAANNNIENGGYFVVEGAYDNGFGSVDSSSYAPISGPVPMVIPSGNCAAVAVTAAGAITTVSAHSLKPGDLVVMYVVTGFATTVPQAKRIYQVLSTPAPNQVILANTGSTTALLWGGTPTAGITIYRLLGGSVGGHRAAAQITPNRRQYYRLAMKYTSGLLAGPTISVSRVGLTVGRDNATTY